MEGIDQRAIEKEAEQIAKRFQFIKVNNQTYKIGEDVYLRETEQSKLIGRIERIVPICGIPKHPELPCVQVSWYYQKNELDLTEAGISKND